MTSDFTIIGIPVDEKKAFELLTTNKKGGNDVADMIEYVEMNKNYDELNKSGTFVVVHEDEFVVWQLFYCDYNDKKYQTDSNINSRASSLMPDRKRIYGKAVAFCTNILSNHSVTIMNASVFDLNNIYDMRQVMRGCIVATNGEIKNVKLRSYEDINKVLGTDKVKMSNFNLYGSSGFFFELYCGQDTKINKLATTINGSSVLYGKVVILLKYNEHFYSELTSTLLKRLYSIMAIPSIYNQPLPEGDMKDEPHVIKNKWYVLHKRELDLSHKINKCWNCEKRMKLKICTGCYRVRYCSEECRKNDYFEHKMECSKKY